MKIFLSLSSYFEFLTGYRVHEIDMYLDSLKMRMESKELEGIQSRTETN